MPSLAVRRSAAQLLHRPPVPSVVAHLLAVQAQDLRSAHLALRARGSAPDASLVRTWLMRGTLHLVTREDYAWLHPLVAPRSFAFNARRLSQLDVSEDDRERAVRVIEGEIASGPRTRSALRGALASAGVPVEGQALPHLLMLASLRGVVVMVGDEFVPAPPSSPLDHAEALALLARRYLRGHGPARAEDLAAWSGLPLRDAREGLETVREELVDEDGGLVDLAERAAPPRRIPPRLLPAFDPYMLGWKDRSFAVPPEHAKRVHPGGGMLRAVATVNGAVVGTWSAQGLDLFTKVPAAAETTLHAEVRAITRLRDG